MGILPKPYWWITLDWGYEVQIPAMVLAGLFTMFFLVWRMVAYGYVYFFLEFLGVTSLYPGIKYVAWKLLGLVAVSVFFHVVILVIYQARSLRFLERKFEPSSCKTRDTSYQFKLYYYLIFVSCGVLYYLMYLYR